MLKGSFGVLVLLCKAMTLPASRRSSLRDAAPSNEGCEWVFWRLVGREEESDDIFGAFCQGMLGF